ncbi:hypothetical protein L5515_016387 [Caenorhabditis briggsae]|uniref:Uncharacterized protein n=1 Tax=Caenorhabditis briggsae TaxID=6238 RepID=A0AAE9FE29_CAEBR|nr:hypothetical protein L5515_016387 [Caenorhabditis briggsae]
MRQISSQISCYYEPFVLISSQTSCAESPPCTHIFCWRNFNCLIASTLSPIISGCRLDGEDIFCICPPRRVLYRKMASNSTSANNLVDDSKVSLIDAVREANLASSGNNNNGLSGGAIAGIVIAVVVGVLLIAVLGFFAFRYIKDRRKNHGEYRPQFEEQHHAKDLPYLQPPNLEGLI